MTSYHGGKQRIGSEIAQIIHDIASQEALTVDRFNNHCY
jgi:hypothetical protein